ncbi:MAG: class I SAM-dependent methyltransferase [Planctomycetota bacterium]|jgi:SAM-dependent methyltransferase
MDKDKYKDKHKDNGMRTGLWLGVAGVALLACAAWAPPDEQDAEIERLRAEVASLRAELDARAGYDEADLAAEASVKPGINDSWKSPNIGPLIGRLETESREIWVHRADLAAVVGAPPGAVVADVGAGSGFMTNIFARQVGPEGAVYAVDINPTLMEFVADGAKAEGLENIETVVCTDKSAELPPASVDIVFICDTYHHFEYPKNTMTSIRRALRPGGQVIVVDFHRIEGKTRPFIMEHVRADEATFTQEILDAGFELANRHDVSFLEENYMLRFRRAGE